MLRLGVIAGGNEDAGTGCVEGAGSFYTDPRGATGYEDGLVRPGIGEGVGGDVWRAVGRASPGPLGEMWRAA